MRPKLLRYGCLVLSIAFVAVGICLMVWSQGNPSAHQISNGPVHEIFFRHNDELLVVGWQIDDSTGAIERSEVQSVNVNNYDRRSILSTPVVVTSAATSKDGRWIALGNNDGVIEVIELSSGNLHSRLSTETELRIASLVFSLHENRLESYCYDTRSENGPTTYHSVWDLDSRRLVKTTQWQKKLKYPPIECGATCAQVRASAIEVRMCSDNSLVTVIETNWRRVNCVAFSHDCRLVAAATGDLTGGGPPPWFSRVRAEVAVWESKTGIKLRAHKAHRGGVQCLAFSPDGRRLASGDVLGKVAVFDVVEK